MKKIFQIGFVLALAALLPTGILFAGDGDGKGKKSQVTLMPSEGTGTNIILVINTTERLDLNSLQVISKTPGSLVKEISPVLGGIQVTIEMDPETFNTNPNDNGGIIIEIVGVDNITGVDVTDGDNGTNIPTSFTGIEEDNSSIEGTSTDNNSSNGYHSQQTSPSTNGGGSGGGTVTVNTSARKDITVYPNPVVDNTNVVTVGEILGRTIEIIDLAGHPVLITNVSQGSRQTTLDLSNLTPGIYVIMYHTQDGQTISKRIQKI
jgi:hypothetical protein